MTYTLEDYQQDIPWIMNRLTRDEPKYARKFWIHQGWNPKLKSPYSRLPLKCKLCRKRGCVPKDMLKHLREEHYKLTDELKKILWVYRINPRKFIC